MTKNAGQGVVEIQRHRARQLQCAVQLLFERETCLPTRRLDFRGSGAAFPQQLEHKILLAVFREGANGCKIANRVATFGLEFERHGRRGRALPL